MIHLKRLNVLTSLAICCLAWWVGGCASSNTPAPRLQSLAERSPKIPVVLVPGITGSELRDRRTGELIWGLGKQIVTPHDGGYELVRPLSDPIDGAAPHVEAGEVLFVHAPWSIEENHLRPDSGNAGESRLRPEETSDRRAPGPTSSLSPTIGAATTSSPPKPFVNGWKPSPTTGVTAMR